MANPLARVVMNNITQRSSKIDTRYSSSNNSFNSVHVDSKGEQLLKSIIGKKKNGNMNSNQMLRTLDSLTKGNTNSNTSNSFNDVANARSNPINKINLEDLIKGNNKTQKKENPITQKSNTMTTLSELAGKAKKNIEPKDTSVQDKKFQKTSTSNYVRTGVINNLEAYIPKVSLDSIGKKGSLLK
ncbi:hypothetical protein [Brassicibacter mesophilus]|uniref:hypothetical protein n=1 Tax=Brassicibacter mesophilus TaxID=745119 RepID=UPI003D1ABA55